jgi:hypothetical protein
VIWYLDVRKWSKYLVVLLLAAAFAGVAHEFGHSLAARAHGRYPRFHWGGGGQVVPYDRAGHPVADRPPAERMITSAAGPLTNLLLAAALTFLYLRRRESFLLFAAAMMNATFRFTMFVDGFNSDEGNVSADLLSTLGNPVEGLSIAEIGRRTGLGHGAVVRVLQTAEGGARPVQKAPARIVAARADKKDLA